MAKVAIIMGSASDEPKLEKCMQTLDELGISYSVNIRSAHRTLPELTATINYLSYGSNATTEEGEEPVPEDERCQVIIAAAGMSAALPGVISALTQLPVIGVPIYGDALCGQDALYSIVQMPPGIPVSCMPLNGAVNAALMAARIIALGNKKVSFALSDYTQRMRKKTLSADAEISQKYSHHPADSDS